MSEEINSHSNKGKSPSKIIQKGNDNSIKSMTEQVTNKSKNFLLSEKLTQDFKEEEEINGISITYKEKEQKVKSITYDLLLKKIVTENFIEKNPIQIFSFCQQCFCFIDKEIIFNKIFNCYNFYKEKKVPVIQIGNLIKFLNILVIEMYEYYSKVSKDDPFILQLKNFYYNIISDVCAIINNEKENKSKEDENLNINDYQNQLEEYNEEENNQELNNINDERCSSLLNEEKVQVTRERFGTIAFKKDDARFSDYLNGNEDKKDLRKTINISSKKQEKEEKKSKKEEKEEKNKKKVFLFFHSKKDKPVKIEDKNEKEKEEKEDFMKENLRRLKALKIPSSTPEEEIITSVQNIILLFSFEEPGKNYMHQAKSHIDFYKDIKRTMAEAIGKEYQDIKSRHNFAKSATVENIGKKTKLKLHENDGFFNVLDWDKKDIGEKLILVSKNLINKVKRREIYKAIFLKKNKEQTSPNVLENIDKFNRLIFFIIQDILSYDFAKDRAKIVEKWIKVADYCKSRKDYNDCIAINSALNNYIITGLNKTQNEISHDKKELLKQINKFCRVQGNYKKLREDMKNLGYTEFYVPYLGMILKDLAFFEENSKYLINDFLINFEKLENVQISMTEFFNFKNTIDKDNIKPPEELDFFDNLEDLKETYLENLANNLEPEFKLYNSKKREKRQTNIDIKYFTDSSVKRPNMRDSKRLSSRK